MESNKRTSNFTSTWYKQTTSNIFNPNINMHGLRKPSIQITLFQETWKGEEWDGLSNQAHAQYHWNEKPKSPTTAPYNFGYVSSSLSGCVSSTPTLTWTLESKNLNMIKYTLLNLNHWLAKMGSTRVQNFDGVSMRLIIIINLRSK